MTSEVELVRQMRDLEWQEVLAMPVQKRRQDLLDVVLITQMRGIAVTADAFDLGGGEEGFRLLIFEHARSGWWSPESGWHARNLGQEWSDSLVQELLQPPRQLRFFTDISYQGKGAHGEGVLRECTAIEISKPSAGADLVAVIRASQDRPCELDLLITREEREATISPLVDITELVDSRLG